jgi:phosphate transport system ATP-binding protein
MSGEEYKITTEGLDLFYGTFRALNSVKISIRPRSITAIIGPSGCGKSTLLRCFNRMNELIPGVRTAGRVLLDGEDIHAGRINYRPLEHIAVARRAIDAARKP